MSPPKMLSFKIFLIFGNWTQATWITRESIIITCGVFFDISLWKFSNAHKSTGYCDDLKLTCHPDLTVIDSHSLLLQLFSCADIFSRKPRLHDISTPDTLRLSITWGPFLRDSNSTINRWQRWTVIWLRSANTQNICDFPWLSLYMSFTADFCNNFCKTERGTRGVSERLILFLFLTLIHELLYNSISQQKYLLKNRQNKDRKKT